jgi:hypothetical protein
MVRHCLEQVLQPPQKYEHHQFSNGRIYEIINYGIVVIFNGMTSLLNFIQI